MKDTGNVARGYKAAISNPHVSDQAREHARQEIDHINAHERSPSGDSRHDANVKRGLKAAIHNPNVTDVGKQDARNRLESMGEQVEEPAD